MSIEGGVTAYDVAVIGGGPAGAAAARAIALGGASVLLVDKAKFPRDKVCGCCLNEDALATLARLGLGDLPRQLAAHPLRALHLAVGRRTAHLPLPEGAAVSRRALDAALTDAARAAGVRFIDRTHASLAPRSANHSHHTHRLMLHGPQGQHRITAGVLLVADGVGGRLLDAYPPFQTHLRACSRIGVGTIVDDTDAAYEPHTIHMACGRSGYVGLVRLEDGRLDVAAAIDPAFIKHMAGPGPAAAAILREANRPVIAGLASGHWHGTARLSRHRRPLAHGGIFLLGDAAGYVEPFTGEGIAWALRTGEMVADLALRAARDGWSEELASEWTARYRRHIAPRQRRCQWIATLLRWPRGMRAITTAAGRLPWAARPLVNAIASPRPAKRAPASAQHTSTDAAARIGMAPLASRKGWS